MTLLLVVMGVSGTGKSTVGRQLAERCGLPFEDGDDLHSPENIAKMAQGNPLSDEDRWPWLERVGQWLREHESTGGVIACSALRRSYRDVLALHAPDTTFVHLAGTHELIAERLRRRHGHFMPLSNLASQFETLEPLEPDERGVAVDIAASPAEIVETARRLLEC